MTAAFKQRRAARNPHAYIIGTADHNGARLLVKVASMGRHNHMWLSAGRTRVVQCDTDKGGERAALDAMLSAVGATLTAIDARAIGHNGATVRNLRQF